MALNFRIATHWNELNEYQRSKITDLVYNSKTSEKGVYLAVLYYLFCPNKWFSWKGFWQSIKFYRLIKQVPLTDLMPFSSFIFEKLNLTKFPRVVKVGKQKFYGPADRLANLSMEELSFTYKFYFDWMTKKEEIDLDRLVSVLYRPKSNKIVGDDREPFSPFTVSERSSILPKLPLATKLSIGLAYKGSVDLIFSRYKEIFPEVKTKKPSKEKPKFQSFVPMMQAMAMGENQPLGDYEKVKATNCNTFFSIVEETIKQAKKAKLEALKNKK